MRLRLRPVVSLLGLCIGVAAIASCDATALTGQPLAGSGGGGAGSVTVYGATTSAATGAVVANLTVTAEDSACTGTSTYGSATGVSTSTGSYGIVVTANSSAAGCVSITGTVSGNPTPVTVTQGGLSFAPGDSVLVNLSFP
ncbi:MAG: hypothetical protein ACRENQ_16395 [Gemmatimonadaceae bacterium]